MSFSNSGAGGTLTLPSPTHPNHIDVQAAVRSLRRSISRSPSKFSLSRSASQSSDVSVASTQSRNPPSPASPSPASPSLRRMASQQLFGTANNAHTPTTNSILSGPSQSHLATPFRPNVKLSLRSAKSSAKGSPSAASKSSLRYRTSPKSPSKRALNSIPPSVTNSVPSPSSDSDSAGQENLFRIRSPAPRRSFERSKSRHSMHLDMSGASLQAATRVHDGNIAPSSSLSPRKRGDATLDMDQSSFGSPKAKRRSYGPSNLGGEFNVFDQGPKSPSPNFDIHDESSREYGWTGAGDQSPPEVGHASPAQVHVPRRAGSLRQSTLKQRERTSWGKRQAAMKLQEFNSSGAATPAANLKGRPRLSLDHYLPPSRDSPFNAPGPLSNASAQPHPLSRTMTTSSSNSSIPDDSPSHFAIRISEKPRAPMNWSKSLPIGAVRPTADDDTFNLGSVSTPDYKSAKPFFGAFASTGLVSKMNRNPELEPLRGHGAAAVPDTPCKKQFNAFATYPPPPGSAIKGRGKHIRHTFGAPSTPFNPMASRSDNQTTFGPRPGLFSDFGNRHARKGSLLSLYSDDGRSPIDQAGDSFMTSEADIPPTPTKQQLLEESTTPIDSPSAKRHLPAPTSAVGLNLWQDEADIASEFTPSKGSCSNKLGASGVAVRCTSDSARPIAPATTPSLVSVSVRSFGHNRAKRGSALTPLPLATLKTAALTEKPPRKAEYAKRLPLFPASPLDKLEFEESTSPKTPLEAVPTLDASRLSISNHNHKLLFPASSGRRSLFPPATPTTRHEAFPLFGDRRAITPTNGLGGHEVDAALVSRFGRVEYLGQGEFSQVFKVVKTDRTTTPTYTPSYSTPTHHTPPSPAPNDVFAVKKLKLPFKGTIDRAMRMREVAALEAMRGAEHILQLIDSWEEHNSLYIQTEYCEEGTLNTFLAKVGAKGRLDDFRIWKILSELAQGVQSIHNAGFVHLDLKPANVLINFEGTLKIGDFGMAAALPVEKGPDFEGDREYLALEVLRGEIDKPADIFSLGLIMLEIAANVKLPDNGATWTALRKGDFSEVPLLTQEANPVLRDATGMPIDESDRVSSSDEGGSGKPSRRNFGYRSAGNLFGLSKKTELLEPPNFMQDPDDVSSLDTVVQWLLTAEPVYRPTISQVLELPALHWVTSRQRAGATVYEGNWGPSDESLEPRTPITLEASPSADTEMTDV